MRKFCSAGSAILLLALIGLAAGSAEASLQLASGVDGGSGDVANVLFGNYSATQGSVALAKTTVFGDFNAHQGAPAGTVDFTSDLTDLFFTPAGGQARIEAVDGAFTYIEFEISDPADYGMNKVQFNIDMANTSPAGSEVRISLFGDSAGTAPNSQLVTTVGVSGAGQNWWTGYGNDGTTISKVVIESLGGAQIDAIVDLQQVRVGVGPLTDDNVPPAAVPEPASLLVWSFLGLAMIGLNRFRKTAAS